MSQFQLYGITAAGRTAHSETLHAVDREALRTLAAERLRQWHAVEIWEGPVCLVRLRRAPEAEP